MRNKVIAALVAGGLLVGAGFVTSFVSAPGTASAQETEAGTDEARGFFSRGLEFLQGVLSDLVSDGTLSQEDADAVADAVETEAASMQAEHEALREAIEAAFEDDVLTEAEAASVLPDDHKWLSEEFDEAWADGELTKDEIRELSPHSRRNSFRKGAQFGALLDDGGIDQEELDSLGEDHPLNNVEGIEDYLADDGLITIDELREIREANRPTDSAETSA